MTDYGFNRAVLAPKARIRQIIARQKQRLKELEHLEKELPEQMTPEAEEGLLNLIRVYEGRGI